MSESKHTRGPWRTHIADSTLVVDADGNEIARTLGDYDTEYEAMETRATFIKAAPDLRAALAECRADLMIHAGNADNAAKSDPRWEGVGEKLRMRIRQADAALSAARGER